jgi:glycosyltransferase involved in cell wall biosynthesis
MSDRRTLAKDQRRILFVQATEPAGYPPLIHASILFAEAGWEVAFLSAPIAGNRLELPPHPRVNVHTIRTRPSHVMSRLAYARYMAATARYARSFRPNVVYASDPLGTAPGVLAARFADAQLVYHEHDTPAPGTLRRWLARVRAAAARRAKIIIFPNEARSRIVQAELGVPAHRLRIVWNLPQRAELPRLESLPESPLILHYHGGIGPDRLPETVIKGVRKLEGRVRLRIFGSETPGARGYLARLLECVTGRHGEALVEYGGQVPLRTDLLAAAARSHVGLALVPASSDDVNMRHMAGASNKPFDCMAAGLALLVSDSREWREMFVDLGFARACDPEDPDAITAALRWFLDHPAERRGMAAAGRAKIANDWNYETEFAPIMAELCAT